MLFPKGHLSIKDAFNRWRENVQSYNAARHQLFHDQPEEGNLPVVIEDSAGMFSADLVRRSIDTFIVLEGAELLRVDSEINRTIEWFEFYEFVTGTEIGATWSEYLDSFHLTKDSWAMEDNRITSAPRIGDDIFLYVEPNHSIVDCSGYDVCNKFLAKAFDVQEWEAIQLLRELYRDDPQEYPEHPKLFERYIRLIELLEYGIPVHLIGRKSPFDALTGRTICFSEAQLSEFLASEYALDSEKVVQTVAMERRAEKAARMHFRDHPNENMRKVDFIKRFCDDLGSRAGQRVWESIAKDYPHLSRAGRKS